MIRILLSIFCVLISAKSLPIKDSGTTKVVGENVTSIVPNKATTNNIDLEDKTSNTTRSPLLKFHVDFTKFKGSEIVADRLTIFEVIPVDYLCDFCNAVIVKLKYRQKVEPEFEKNMLEECWKYNGTQLDDGNICELINKVALDRLRNDEPSKICVDEKMCPDIAKQEKEIKEKELKKKEELAKRKLEDEERKRNKELESIKTEAARLEYERQQDVEKKRKLDSDKILSIHTDAGEEEYVVDEVGKEEDERNDYLDNGANPKKGLVATSKVLDKQKTRLSTTLTPNKPQFRASVQRQKSLAFDKNQLPNLRTRPVKLSSGKITNRRVSGDANVSIRYGQLHIDREVHLKLDVADP